MKTDMKNDGVFSEGSRKPLSMNNDADTIHPSALVKEATKDLEVKIDLINAKLDLIAEFLLTLAKYEKVKEKAKAQFIAAMTYGDKEK